MNPADVLVLAVPHTGAHFMLALIPEATHLHPTPTKRDTWQPQFEAQEGKPIICPMRHPQLVGKSWRKRGKALADLDAFWSVQARLIDLYSPYYICLDRPELRDGQVKKINRDLDLELNPGDWPVLRDRVIHNALELTEAERSYVSNYHHAPHEAFFDRWY